MADLVMWAVIAAGLIFGSQLTREFFPETRPNRVQVSAPYPGASPDEVENSIAKKIEDALTSLDNVKEITSTVVEGGASVVVEFEDRVRVKEAVAEVKREIDALQDFPAEAERITVRELEPNLPVIVLSIFGDAPEAELKHAILEVRDDLRSLPRMGDVLISGIRTNEIRVEVEPTELVRHDLSIAQVADRVRQSMLELPGGSVRSSTSTIAVRTLGAEERADAVREIPIKATDGGFVLRLGDIATVTEGFADVDLAERLNGKPSVSVTILKIGRQDAVRLAEIVKAYAAGLRGDPFEATRGESFRMLLRRPGSTDPVSDRQRAWELGSSRAIRTPLPGDVALTTDLARFIVGRLDLLTRNAITGGCLVFLTLMLFLNLRVSLWVTGGMAISIIGTLAVMRFAGISLNLLSMFGLIIVVGLLVDDAIVVAENITAKHEAGAAPDEAAIAGAEQVAWPVVGTVLTTICAFLPLTFLDGQTGELLSQLPMVAACALAVSLLESLFILPRHMSHALRAQDRAARSGRQTLVGRLESGFDRAREAFLHERLIPAYARLLTWCLRRRWMTLTLFVAALIASLGMLAGGRLKFVFLDSSDAETVTAELRMPVGTPLIETDRIARKIERAALDQPEVVSVYALVGSISSLSGDGGGSQQTHLAQLIMELAPVEQRERTSDEVIVAIRKSLGQIPGVKSLRIQGMVGGPEGTDITLTATGADPALLAPVAARIEDALADFDGVYDIANDADRGQRELRIRLRPGASELGFTTENVARQIRASVFGLEAHTFPGRLEDVDVRVTLPESARRSIATIESLRLLSPGGRSVPLAEICTLDETEDTRPSDA
ncbi:MAG: efflux RND transporter permease subunit [Phycisphaeraceae bacterium]|nr:efflux RND transporter permease subunit [Phycisphaeraceae bacterium]